MSIDPDLLRLMVYHAQVECRFALYRILDAENMLLLNQLHPWLLLPREEPEAGHEDPMTRLHHYNARYERAHLAVHDFLTHAANVAKICFPDTARGAALRDTLGVTYSMEIMNRQSRNDIEHFDERLETFYHDKHGLDVFDLNTMPFGASTPSGPPAPADTLRNFDGTGAYTFRGHSIDLAKVREELEGILE